MDNIVPVNLIVKKFLGPEPEGEGLGKARGGDPDPLQQIDGIAKFFKSRNPEQGFRVIQIKGGETIDLDSPIEERIRRAGYNLDLMAQVLEGLA